MIKEDVNRAVKIYILFFLTPFSHHLSDLTASSHILENLTGFSQPVNLFSHHSHSKRDMIQVQKKRSLIDIVRIGKQLLMTRGSLTTFSIANDVSKYFAIIPALFMGLYPGLARLNIMGLYSPQSAVLSAIIYTKVPRLEKANQMTTGSG